MNFKLNIGFKIDIKSIKMGAKSGSVISSIPSSFFEGSNYLGSNCSVRSREGRSSSKSSNRYENQKEKEIYGEREKLLNSKIREIRIGIEPIGLRAGHIISYSTKYIRSFLPSHLGGGTFTHHASCWLRLDCSEEIILEYGGYTGGDITYKHYIHYAEEDGLRFSIMNYNDYLHTIKNDKIGSEELFFLDFENIMTLQELIDKCNEKEGKKWIKNNYNLSSHNCQDFVATVIEILKVSRSDNELSKFRHNMSIATYPPVIVNALEKNENRNVINFIESLPVVGRIIEFPAFMYSAIKGIKHS